MEEKVQDVDSDEDDDDAWMYNNKKVVNLVDAEDQIETPLKKEKSEENDEKKIKEEASDDAPIYTSY
jgi:hypothetical protein